MNPKRYLVILADRAKGRFFTIYLNDFEDEYSIKDPAVPHRSHVEGARMNKRERHIRDHLKKHLQLIGLRALNFVKARKIDGVIIGGHKELLNTIKANLPGKLKQKVIGEFVTSLDLSLLELTQKAKIYTF